MGGEEVVPDITKPLGLLWAVTTIVLVFILLKKGKMNRWIGTALLSISSLLGFLIFSPMLPLQFQDVFDTGLDGKGPMLVLPLVGLLVVVVSSSAVGRIFCGYSCPVGAV